MRVFLFLFCFTASIIAGEYLIIGLDQKVTFDTPGLSKHPPGKDSVLIYDIYSNPGKPKLTATLSLENSVFGPPTNLAITPDGSLAFVANAVRWIPENNSFKQVPDNTLNLIPLNEGKPGKISQIKVGKQPSGISISRDGSLLAVANRADSTISLLTISGQTVAHKATIPLSGQISSVAILPDMKALVATHFDEHKVSYIPLTNGTPSEPIALPVGLWPYNIKVTPNSRFAIVANTGNSGLPDGHVDTVSVIDLKSTPPRVADHIPLGDAPEGLAISPSGTLAVTALLQGSAPMFDHTSFANPQGGLAMIMINDLSAKHLGTIDTGRFPEGIAFNKTGTHFYVGDHTDQQLSVFAVVNRRVQRLEPIKLPGYPASVGSQAP